MNLIESRIQIQISCVNNFGINPIKKIMYFLKFTMIEDVLFKTKVVLQTEIYPHPQQKTYNIIKDTIKTSRKFQVSNSIQNILYS